MCSSDLQKSGDFGQNEGLHFHCCGFSLRVQCDDDLPTCWSHVAAADSTDEDGCFAALEP